MAPEFPDAHSHLGWELAKAGRFDEAITELRKAIELRPDSVEFHANLGYVLGQSGDLSGAVSAFEKAVELSGRKDLRCLDMLARAYYKLGMITQAISSEQQALELANERKEPQIAERLRTTLPRYKRETSKPPQ